MFDLSILCNAVIDLTISIIKCITEKVFVEKAIEFLQILSVTLKSPEAVIELQPVFDF